MQSRPAGGARPSQRPGVRPSQPARREAQPAAKARGPAARGLYKGRRLGFLTLTAVPAAVQPPFSRRRAVVQPPPRRPSRRR